MPSAKTILTRIVFGAIMIAALACVLAVEYYEPWPAMMDIRGLLLAAVIVVLCVMALRELKRIASAAGAGLLGVSAHLGTLLVATQPVWHKCVPLNFVLMMTVGDVWCMIGLIVAGVFLEQMIRHRLDAAVARVGATLLAVAYLGVGTAIVLAIRVDKGVPALILFLAAVKCADIGAYFTGSAIGRHKLIAWLSPGKSWKAFSAAWLRRRASAFWWSGSSACGCRLPGRLSSDVSSGPSDSSPTSARACSNDPPA